MALSPQEISKQITQAKEAFKNKEYNQAVAILNSIIQTNPDFAVAYRMLGSVLMYSPSQEKALNCFNKAIELSPGDANNWSALGHFHKKRKAWAEALKAFIQSLNYQKEQKHTLEEILRIYYTLGNHQQALAVIIKLRLIDPDSTQYLWNYAQLLKNTGQDVEALKQYDLLVKSGKNDISIIAIEEWHALMTKYNLSKEAHNWLTTLSDSNQEDALLKYLYALSCKNNHEHKKSLQVLEEALRLAPDNDRINYSLGAMYAELGNRERSSKYFKKALDINPLSIQTLRYVGESHTYTYGDDYFKQLNFAVAHMHELKSSEKAELHYTLGKAYDDVGDLTTAFEHFKLGGALYAQGREKNEYDFLQNILDTAKKTIGKDFFEQNREMGCESEKPVFIVGMIRSGSTLMEQVLSGIKGVEGIGELNYTIGVLNHIEVNGSRLSLGETSFFSSEAENRSYKSRGEYYLKLVEALAPGDAKRIIDKTLINYSWLGYLHLILPRASFIHIRRHPVETCLSAYKILFDGSQYWSGDLRMMGKIYRLYTEFMTHWKSVLPEGSILDVHYEDMVTNLERESKRLADHIGMPWDASCLEFHASKKAVRTASLSQVRQPIYKTSMNRWRKYEPYLQPLLDEIGDLIEEYEAELTMNNN